MYYIKGHGWVRILSSARKHGVADGDILHVLVHAVLSLMVRDTDEVTRVIHAMPMRRKYVPYLTEDRRHDR